MGTVSVRLKEILMGWIRRNFIDTLNLRLNGKFLKGKLKDYWSCEIR